MRKQPNPAPKTARKPAAPPTPPPTGSRFIICTNIAGLALAFTEWERQYRRNPAAFWTEAERLAESPRTYGDLCAPHFAKLLGEVQKARRA